jgi:large subunit ribosomal protein L16
MISKKRSVNISAKFFRKVGYNKPFISSNKPKGDVCLIATERGVIKKEVLESFRRVVTKKLNRLGKISIPLTFNIPCSAKPSGIRMGKGKGKISKYIARVSSGTVLLEINTYNRINAAKALLKALRKLPLRTRIQIRSLFFND